MSLNAGGGRNLWLTEDALSLYKGKEQERRVAQAKEEKNLKLSKRITERKQQLKERK